MTPEQLSAFTKIFTSKIAGSHGLSPHQKAAVCAAVGNLAGQVRVLGATPNMQAQRDLDRVATIRISDETVSLKDQNGNGVSVLKGDQVVSSLIAIPPISGTKSPGHLDERAVALAQRIADESLQIAICRAQTAEFFCEEERNHAAAMDRPLAGA